MIKRYAPGYLVIILSLIVFLIIIGSIRYVDARIAVSVMNFLRSIKSLHKATDNIPDILPHLVGTGTVLMWVIYLYRLHKKKRDAETQFLLLSATALPAAYLLKMFFQFTFGRTSTRSWLIEGRPLMFNWFHGINNGCFPSGHMTVFAAFGTAILLYYPKYRQPVLILLSLLGIALIATDYHFLSDVIAGAYLGAITTYSLWYMFGRGKVKI